MKTNKKNVEVRQDPGNHKWFIVVDGLMDVDAGYFEQSCYALEFANYQKDIE